MKNLFLSIITVLLISNGYSQNDNRKWAVGASFGTKEYYGDLGSEFWTIINNHGAFGINIYRYLNSSFDAMGSFSHGLIDFEGGKGTFKNSLFDYNLSLKYKFDNGYILAEDYRLSPFVFIGGGLTYSESGHYTNLGENDIDFGIPVGLGLNIKVNEAFAVEVRTLTKYSFSDNLDNNQDSPFEQNFGDIFNYHSLGVVYSFGKTDQDKDGIADKDDKCPTIAGSETANGCPDADKDGVADADDKCPNVAGKLNGCPDTDNDLVADKDDKCPNTPGKLLGCPDKDGDKIADKDDECPDLAGTIKGCPDTDKDGIADKNDKCPSIYGTLKGCPDTDKDGIADIDDACPKVYGTIKGCPDTDKDGIIDSEDACPNEAGLKENKGCPKVKKEEEEVLIQAMKGLFFKTGSAVIKPESYAKLNNVVSVMNNNSKINLSIEGHTDNVGNPTSNLNLSKRRAESARNYLIQKGVDASRLTAIGYGNSRPIAENTTQEGRTQNRRVEFVVK